MTDPILVAACIPTLRRPRMLSDCLSGLVKINVPSNTKLRIIIVDNDAEGSAKSICDSFEFGEDVDLRYVIEENRGLSNVRNRCLKEVLGTDARYLLFIDDDVIPHPELLARHLSAVSEFDAQISRGSVKILSQDGVVKLNWDAIEPDKPRVSGSIARKISTNNVLLDIDLLRRHETWFDPFFNFIGGEDHDFFDRLLSSSGAKAVWCNEALICEVEPAERETFPQRKARTFRGAIGNVMKYRYRNRFWIRALLHYVPKIVNKLLSGTLLLVRSLLTGRTAREKGILQFCVASGYLAGLVGGSSELYRDTDGN